MPKLPLDVRGRLALLEQQARERVAEASGGEKCRGSRAGFSVLRMIFRTRPSSGSVPVSVQNTHSGILDQPRLSVSVLHLI